MFLGKLNYKVKGKLQRNHHALNCKLSCIIIEKSSLKGKTSKVKWKLSTKEFLIASSPIASGSTAPMDFLLC